MITENRARKLASAVPDPELPMVGIGELGIVREVNVADSQVTVVITPTYTACPALETIEHDITAALLEGGAAGVCLLRQLSPAWSTDWITPAAREKLERDGIAPPAAPGAGRVLISLTDLAATAHTAHRPRCPQCASERTAEVSAFGSTACKAHWRCRACGEPFDAIKTVQHAADAPAGNP